MEAINTSKARKYNYEIVIQQLGVNGWDDVEYFEADSTFYMTIPERQRLKMAMVSYQTNQPQYSFRSIRRRSLNK